MPITIKDIAKQAGVSFSTVSKALRNSPLVTNKTKKRILKIAGEMSYFPNNAARSLVSRRTYSIGVVWPSIERLTHSVLITNINAMLETNSYTTLLSINQVDAAVDTFNRFNVDAILVFDDQQAVYDRSSLASNVPLLFYGISGNNPYPTIDANRKKAIQLAFDHLIELGHKRISYIGNLPSNDHFQEEKVSAFREKLHEYSIPELAHMVVTTDNMDSYDGYSAAKSLLTGSQRPTAIISGSYDLTRGILKAAKELSIDIPNALSIISYDHIPQMDELDVPITAVGVPILTIAETITQVLLDIANEKEVPDSIHLEPEILVRKSTHSVPMVHPTL
ncbi:MAG: LacI family DNA-binding transcriptional regulator [Paenibacillaceae bacterium]